MKHITAILLLLTATFLLAQVPQAQTPPPTPPADVDVRIRVDGVNTNIDITPEAIAVLNKFLHQQGYTGTFGERFIAMISKTIQVLAERPELSTAAKTEIDAANAKIKKAAEDAAKARVRAQKQ